jgi:Leucine-rich repeat (LRR) protein
MDNQDYFDKIKQLLYSADVANTELALQLIEGLDDSDSKTELQELYTILERVAAQNIAETIAELITNISSTYFFVSTHEEMNPLLKACRPIVEMLEIDVRRKNDLPYFTDALMQFTNLKYCNLKADKDIYFELPKDFGRHSKLETFTYDSEYKNLPDDFLAPLTQCPNVQRLYFSAPYLTAFPSYISTLVKLKALVLMNFPLADLPDFFADLPQLEELNISFLNEQNAIPSIVFKLPQLRNLLLDELNITQLPEAIFSLSPAIKILKLRNTQISPKHINYWHERLHRTYPNADILITSSNYDED